MSAHARDFDAVDVESFTGPLKPKTKRAATIGDAAFAKLRDQAREAMTSGDWNDVGARVFVALFAEMYARVYGVECSELTPSTRMLAAYAAGRLLEREFNGDAYAMAMFVRWTWLREKDRETWRRANGRDGGSIHWRLQFNGRLLDDYRLAKARSHVTARTG